MIKTIDTVILMLLLVLTIKGIWRGLKKELISLLTYGIAFLTATSQLDNGTRFFEQTVNFHPLLGYFVSYFAVFFIVLLVVKFFVKNIMKIISREPSSGIVDSIGGMVFGFCLGMIIVGIYTSMLKPIPVLNTVFEQKHKSLFLPLSEKFAEPIAAKFMINPADKIPLDELLSKGLGENLVLPDIMQGLLGDQLGSLPETAGGRMPAGMDIQQELQKAIKQTGTSIPATQKQDTPQKPAVGALEQAMQILQADTSSEKMSIEELLNLIKQ